MKAPSAKLRVKHIPGCHAVEYTRKKTWNSPWSFEGMEWRNAYGNKRQSNNRRWLVFRCNIMECPAQLIVHADFIEEQFSAGRFLEGA